MNLDHVGIAVGNLDEGISFYCKNFRVELIHREEIPSQNVRVAFLAAGGTSLELLEPMGDDGALAKFIRVKGPGLHHIAFQADGITNEMTRLSAAGLPAMESSPRPGARGHTVCFFHPKNSFGTLIELVQPGTDHG
jgi:methylmalonyl-CoA epimerase